MGLLPEDIASVRLELTTTEPRAELIARLSRLVERSPRTFAESWVGEVGPNLVRVQRVAPLRLFTAPLHFEGRVTSSEPAVLVGRFVADETLPFALLFFGAMLAFGALVLGLSGLVGERPSGVGAGLGGLGSGGLLLTLGTRPLWRREARATEDFLRTALEGRDASAAHD